MNLQCLSFEYRVSIVNGRVHQSRSSSTRDACASVGVWSITHVTSRTVTNGASSSHVNRCDRFHLYFLLFKRPAAILEKCIQRFFTVEGV
jgi:hypothetical protein